MRVPLREEELVVGKQQQEAGKLHLRKDVTEEQQTATAPVTREEITVERVPVQGQNVDTGPEAFVEQEVDIPIMDEQLVAGKRTAVNEEVHIHKQPVTEEQSVSDTVRKERLHIEGTDERVDAQDFDEPSRRTEEPFDQQQGY